MLSKSFDFTLAPHMHEHPGENGNISLNEAAMVAAGFGFRRIRSVNDHPPSFSRPIAAYAMILNDNLQYVDRSELLPFVTRLSGTADTPEVERVREDFLAIETVRRIISVICIERLKNETPVTVELISNGRGKKKARIVLAISLVEGASWLLGLEFDSPVGNFWEIANPPADWQV